MDYNYTQAIAGVNAGQYAWYPGFPSGSYIFLYQGTIYHSTATGPGDVYSPTPADKAATTWALSDHPPH